MRGYRCDNCLDFSPEVTHERSAGQVYNLWGGEHRGPPETWLVLSPVESGVSLHFCTPGCLSAFSEKHLAAWAG